VTEDAVLLEEDMRWRFNRVLKLYDFGLHYTPCYRFHLKIAVAHMMLIPSQFPVDLSEDIKGLEDDTQLLLEVFISIKEWVQKPWKNILKENPTPLFVKGGHVSAQ